MKFPWTKRTHAPQSKMIRVFDSAKTDELTWNWFAGSIGVNQAIESRLKLTRQRAHDLERNSSIINRYINILQTNVVGPSGFRFRNKSIDLITAQGKTTERPDSIANDAIQYAWERYARSVTAGGQSLNEVLNILVNRVPIDGEWFCLKQSGGEYGLQLLPIEAERLDYEYSDPARNIIHGTEFEKNWKVKGYYFKQVSLSSELYGYGFSGADRFFVPASQVYYMGKRKFQEQVRCMPWITPVMYPLYQIGKYQEAEIVAAATAAAKMGFFETQSGVMIEYSKNKEAIGMDAKAGTIEQIPDGLTFKPWDPQHPTAQYGEFLKAKMREIASGLNISYFQLASDLSDVNYTSSRTGLLEDRAYYEGLQNWIINSFLIPLFEDWLRDALALEKIKLPSGKALPIAAYQKLNRPHFQGRRWQWVDPQKEVNAYVTAIENRLASPIRIIEAQGSDAWDVYSDIATAQAWQDELGIRSQVESLVDQQPIKKDDNDDT